MAYRTFNLVNWLRARRLKWLGEILSEMGPVRQVKQAVYEMFRNRHEGDLLMDAPKHNSWRELCSKACDRDLWAALVRKLTHPVLTVDIGSHHVEGETLSFTIS